VRIADVKLTGGKVILTIVLLAVAFGVFMYQGRGGPPPRSDKVQFICVETGKTYWLPRGAPETRVLPAKNPDTSKKTLVPVRKDDDGKLYVIDHCRGLVQDLGKANSYEYVDPETLAVRNQ
jgi:hypothetical protein